MATGLDLPEAPSRLAEPGDIQTSLRVRRFLYAILGRVSKRPRIPVRFDTHRPLNYIRRPIPTGPSGPHPSWRTRADMNITAYCHRRQLLQITERWLANRLAPDDALQITRIVTYDGFIAWHTMVAFVQSLTRRLGHAKVRTLSLYRKKDLKDFITAATPTASPRAAELIAAYRSLPDAYYIGSPMAGYLLHDPAGRVLSICRFKRTKRIAEKASRYAALHLCGDLRRQTQAPMGVADAAPSPAGHLSAEPQARTEAEIIAAIRSRGLRLPRRVMEIRDVVGAKIIDWGFGPAGLEAAVADLPGATVLEKEVHRGVYNAIHYTVGLQIQPDPIVAAFGASPHQKTCRRRGLPDAGTDDFASFLRSGAPDLSLDLILTTHDELLESELGRSMHETRIFRQRQERALYGNIALNIEYLIEYLLAVGLSPATIIDEIPIKLWGRYLPDTLSYCIRRLYGIPEFTLIDG
jgi:hypothetical protein